VTLLLAIPAFLGVGDERSNVGCGRLGGSGSLGGVLSAFGGVGSDLGWRGGGGVAGVGAWGGG